MTARPLRVLVCPQEFKGSLTASEAAAAIAAGARRAWPEAEVVTAPMADGGPGTAEIVLGARGGEWVHDACSGPLGAPLDARFALLAEPLDGSNPGREAVIEAAATVGLELTPPDQRDPARGWSTGVGQQLRRALAAGATRIIVGVGGTGTNDGGAGAMEALGYRLLDRGGHELPRGPFHLEDLDRIDRAAVDPALARAQVRVAVDVRNRLLGPEGATAIYGPQKGVGPELGEALEGALAHWAEVVQRALGVDIAAIEGGGAGGGLAAGLVAACGASVESGAALVAGAIDLASRIEWCDVVVTGEGRLDAQSSYGKTVAHVAELAAVEGRLCLAVAGAIEAAPAHVSDAEAAGAGVPLHEALARAAELTAAAAERLALRHRGVVARA